MSAHASSGGNRGKSVRKRILIVQDDALFVRSVSAVLRSKGYDVLQAVDSQRAMEHLQSEHVDLIISDILTPNAHGVELVVRVKRETPETRIIGMTGDGIIALNDASIIALRLGASRILARPFTIDQLVDAVAETFRDDHGADSFDA